MILSNDGLVAFHYRSYGTFFLHKIGSIISIGDLPTTNIIEPKKSRENLEIFLYYFSYLLASGKRNPIPTQAKTPAPITKPLESGKISRIALAMIKAIIKLMRLAL